MIERISPEPENKPDKPKKRNISRRNFLKGAGVTAVTGIVLERTGVLKKAGELYEEYEEDKFREKIQKEKELTQADIKHGLDDQKTFSDLLKERNALVERQVRLAVESDEYKKFGSEVASLDRKIDSFCLKKGDYIVGPSAEANEHAEELAKNNTAVSRLALARVLYSEGVDNSVFGNKGFTYWHNCALAYLELGQKSEEQIKARFKALFEYAEANNVKVSQIPFEKLLYCLIDDDFDFSLQPSALEADLVKRFPNWKNNLPTHTDKKGYAHYNDLSVLDIFELNRLKTMLTQLNDETFSADVFRVRDADLGNPWTEFGGVIPRPANGNKLQVIPPKREHSNDTYLNSDKEIVHLLASVGGFHFHSSKKEQSPDVVGPSGLDGSFFAPEVVFTSLNNSTIAVHFSTLKISELERRIKHEVVFLGEIKKVE